jgi:HEAT repeat protein
VLEPRIKLNESQMLELQEQVEKFKHWAVTVVRRSGEWECDYEHWQGLWSSALGAIALYADGEISNAAADDLLYALARDNECEHIRENLVATPKLVTALAKRAVASGDADAKWQIAISVAEAQLPNAEELLRPFLTDDDEYVRRMSLLSIAPYVPREAEAIAINNLKDSYEYTRIAALHVLHATKSAHLDASLEWLASDPNEYVRRNVAELRVAQHGL